MRNKQTHTLSGYIRALADAGLLVASPGAGPDPDILQISYDSREARAGCLFICKGAHFNEGYFRDAVAGGAVATVHEAGFDTDGVLRAAASEAGIPAVEVSDMRRALAVIANLFYNEVWRELNIIGVTGTKGKSTTAYYVKSVLDGWLEGTGRKPCAILSGIDVYDGVIREESHLTTPETFELHRHFANAVDSGIEYLVMEVSSQALKYERTRGIVFAASAFLNIGTDHISPIEHSDFEDYFASKLRIFPQSRTACVNADIPQAERVRAAARDADAVVTFGSAGSADIRAENIVSTREGISFDAVYGGAAYEAEMPGTAPRSGGVGEGGTAQNSGRTAYRLGMTGLFNVSNALAAIALCRSLNVPEEYIVSGLFTARAAGRMEVIADGERTIIVDYAHNQMSFEALFASVREEYPGSKISIVFGCPGKKALGRRRELGEAAGRHCDLCILTEEDAGEEPVIDICNEIAGYVAAQGCPYEIIEDRREAIARALDLCRGNYVVLITGKGRETRQKRGIEYIDTPSDIDYVEAALGQSKPGRTKS
ncbi:MAG: UDP-N-acetylmuramoyl-L-alanyl-D-glutamate--2,6-diaminopimelate ligase [Clostridiales Family XIII bacterium]|jgi:UDP-N-acetylmuramyl-tripeptide synthetase|nr:UDP-N-acetylmuramoyl-L-alanyl-D-glutamate--2,6-diaminopimelate ligase [Clostridiales Family XIII bacterium]